ncbi:MAG: glycosyltransferase family 4 protein [Hahellaceae bacterium]|nr:glycosyltransferase family 4 protein [Hahellaceae bacterium]
MLRQLANELSYRNDVTISVVDTGGIRFAGVKGLLRFFRVIKVLYVQICQADVVTLHINRTALAILGPIIWGFSRYRKRPYIVRLFAGSGYAVLPLLPRLVSHWVVSNSDSFLVETEALRVEASRKIEHLVRWFPNSRPMPSVSSLPMRVKCRKFIYLGRVYKEKGIAEMISAVERFEIQVQLDVYGPFWFGAFSEHDFSELTRATYCGAITPQSVHNTLLSYDALILPTYDPTEGYPGVVLEAFSAGLPVICTNTGGLSEMVDDTCGIIIPPQDANALYEAMRLLVDDEELYFQLQLGVRSRRSDFASEIWTDRFVRICWDVLQGMYE